MHRSGTRVPGKRLHININHASNTDKVRVYLNCDAYMHDILINIKHLKKMIL